MAGEELSDLRKQCIASLYLCTDIVCKYLDDERDAEFQKLKSHVNDYCLLEAQEKVESDAFQKAKDETTIDNLDTLDDRFKKYLDKMTRKKLNINNHPYMLEFNNRINKGLQVPTANLDDSDLAVTNSQETYIDPFLKKPIEDPVRNRICGHIYERQSTLKVIQLRQTKCPVIGCKYQDVIVESNLIPDEELRCQLSAMQYSPADQSTVSVDN